MHEYGVVASTLHQCFKFIKDGVLNTIWTKSCFADAKFYLDKNIYVKGPSTKSKSTREAILKASNQLCKVEESIAKDEKLPKKYRNEECSKAWYTGFALYSNGVMESGRATYCK